MTLRNRRARVDVVAAEVVGETVFAASVFQRFDNVSERSWEAALADSCFRFRLNREEAPEPLVDHFAEKRQGRLLAVWVPQKETGMIALVLWMIEKLFGRPGRRAAVV